MGDIRQKREKSPQRPLEIGMRMETYIAARPKQTWRGLLRDLVHSYCGADAKVRRYYFINKEIDRPPVQAVRVAITLQSSHPKKKGSGVRSYFSVSCWGPEDSLLLASRVWFETPTAIIS